MGWFVARVSVSTFSRLLACSFLLLASVVAHAADGDLDPGFASALGGARSIALQSNGKIVAAIGAGTSQMKLLNADGSLDGNLGQVCQMGICSVDFVTVAPDDRILAAGTYENYNGSGFPVFEMYDPSGASSQGVAHPEVSFVLTASVLSDGKIIIAGSSCGAPGHAFSVPGQYSTVAGVTRLLADGGVDSSFNPGSGINSYSYIFALAEQQDAKYVIGGNFTAYDGTTRNRIARINANGTVDTSFDPGAGVDGDVQAMVIQPNEKIIIAGNFTALNGFPANGIARLNSDGSRDAGFNAGANVDNSVRALALQPDGKILVGTSTRLVRLKADGSLDASFNSSFSSVNAIVLQSDGKALVAGDGYIVRLDTLTFDTDGDGVGNAVDNCPSISNSDQLNSDGDSQGNACDTDDDNDGVPDVSDVFPLDPSESADTDGDGIGNNADTTPNGDTDNDGIDNLADNCPAVSNASQTDTDGDGVGDACDHYLQDPSEWADHDQDGLPDNWETAQGRNPSRPDYQIASTTYDFAGYVTDSCSIINGAVKCTWGRGGGIPGTVPFSSGVSPADAYGVYLSNNNVVLYRGDSTNSYTNSWDLQSYPPSVANVASPFTVRTLPTSFSAKDKITIGCGGVYGTWSADQTRTCQVSGPQSIACTLNTPYEYQPGPGQCVNGSNNVVTTFTTKGTIAHIAGDMLSVCAMTEYGPECFGGSNPFSGTYDPDSDGVSGLSDNCPLAANPAQTDSDNDGVGDACDAMPNDTDNDGVDNLLDNCPLNSNADQLNTDGDTQGNVCDTDDDNDGVPDVSDVFPLDPSESADTDGDGIGNNADTTPNGDTDNDGIDNLADNCPAVSNASQTDADGDGIGDVCDITPHGDTDGDGIDNNVDNCPAVTNADQKDTDGDGIGDACDTMLNGDSDNDGVDNSTDNCPAVSNTDQLDTDNDGFGDVCDLYPNDPGLLLQQDGTAKNEQLGSSVALADMNNDGVVDLLVGSPLANVTINGTVLKKAGQIRIISGKDNSTLRTFNGSAANAQLGAAMAVVPDQNKDGVLDIIVGDLLADVTILTPTSFQLLKDAGRVMLYSGNDGRVLLILAEGKHAGDHFGAAVASVDVNGDAKPDLIVGAPRVDVAAKDAGQVTVFNGLSNQILFQRNGEQAGENFGAAVAIDNSHLFVGSPLFDAATMKDTGRVSIFNNSEGNSAALLTVDGSAKGDSFSAAITAANDSWAAGAPLADGAGKDAGSVLVYSGINATPVKTLSGAAAGDNFGSALNMRGDVNKDGKTDIAIGAARHDVSGALLLKDAGRVQVVSGAAL